MRYLLLLLLIVFGFGQTSITTKEYSIPISNSQYINIMGLIGETNGLFQVHPLIIRTSQPSYEGSVYIVLQNQEFQNSYEYYLDCQAMGSTYLDCWSEIETEDYARASIEFPNCYLSYWANHITDANLILRITGPFSQDDSNLNGDLNYDNNIDIYDIILMVNLVLDGFNSVNVLEIMNLKS